MENTTNQNDNLFNLSIEGAARDLLVAAATWARIIAIVGFVSAGLSVLAAMIGKPDDSGASIVGGVIGAMIGAAIAVAINIFLFRFATNTLASVSNMSQVQFNEGISNLKTYFKIVGIIVIIVIVLVLLVFMFYGLGRGIQS
jgi:magnesium-transporting ATPase (P-type)